MNELERHDPEAGPRRIVLLLQERPEWWDDDPAVSFAAALAVAHSARLHVVRPNASTGARCLRSLEARLEAELAARGADWSADVLEWRRAGDPARQAVRLAEELDADLIVVEVAARHGLERLRLDPRVELVVRHAACPVLVAGGETATRIAGDPVPRSALVAVDGSAESRAALELVAGLARANDFEIDAVRVIEDRALPTPHGRLMGPEYLAERLVPLEEARNEVEGWIAAMNGPARRLALPIVRVGNPALVLGELARAGHYDLVACGTRGGASRRHALSGRVSDTLLGLGAPTLVVRSGRAAARVLDGVAVAATTEA